MIFKEVRIFGIRNYPCYFRIMAESVAVCLLFKRLVKAYKLKASCSCINIFLCNRERYEENHHCNFSGQPAAYYYLCDMEKVISEYPAMSDEDKRLFFFEIIQKVIFEACDFFHWDKSVFETVFPEMQSAGLRDCYNAGKAITVGNGKFKLSLDVEGDLYEYKFYAVLFDKLSKTTTRRYFASHTTRDRFIYRAVLNQLNQWQIIDKKTVCLDLDNKYRFELPELNFVVG